MKFRRIETDYVAIGLIAFCLILIGAFELFSPSKVITRAVNKSFCEYSQRETANMPWINESVDKTIEEGNVSADFAINASEGSLKGAGLSFSVDRNDSKKTAQANLNLNYNGTAALAVKAYADNENVILSSPMLYDKNIQIDVDTISKNIYNQSGIHYDENTKQNIFFEPNVKDNTYLYTYDYISKGIKASGIKSWSKVQNVALTKLDKTEVNGYNCKGYEVRLNGEDSKILISEFVEALSTDSNFKKGLSAYCEKQFNSNPMVYQFYYGVDSADKLASLYVESYKYMINQILEQGEVGEATAQFYINSGRLIRFQAVETITLQGQTLDINAYVNFDGSVNPTDNLGISLSLSSQGNETRFDVMDTNNIEGTKYTTNKSLTVINNVDVNSVSLATTYDKNDNSFTAKAAMEYNDAVVLSAEANGTVESKDGYITADAEKITFNSDGNITTCNGHLYIKPLENNIEPIEGEAVDILNMEENEASEILNGIQEKLSGILSKIGA
ncbi:MAG: hypothetical protein ACI4VF_02075 [Lachnospirales bacterium]